MTRKVKREELLDYQTYAERRDEFRAQAMALKDVRRVHVGDYLTFLFEGTDTIRYQIQEMMRVEEIVKEEAIRHEMDTYNAMLGDDGELGCTLLIEVTAEDNRREKLTRWLPLPHHLYVKLADGSKIYASFDEGQIGEDRVSAVQYLKFDTQGAVPVAVGTDFEELAAETQLNADQLEALRLDLSEQPATRANSSS